MFPVITRRIALATIALSACGRLPAAEFQPPSLFEPELPTRASAGTVGYPGGVRYLPDITYKSVTGYRPLKLDLYLPKPAGKPAPLVLWVHGGGYEIGNPRADWTYGDWRKVLAELAGRGYAVAAITYRFSAEAPFPAQLQDSQDALRFVRSHAALWNIDATRAVAWGLSAGGNLVALLGTSCGPQGSGLSDGKQPSACVQGVVDWFGPTDFTKVPTSATLARFLGCSADGCTDAQRAAASPARQVNAATPPFVLMQGGADPLVPPEQSQAMADALQAQGIRHELILYPGLGHGFTGATPEKLREILLATFAKIGQLAGRGADNR